MSTIVSREDGTVTSPAGKTYQATRTVREDGSTEVVYAAYVPGTSRRGGYSTRRTASARVAATFTPRAQEG